jgi:hypothetical protein
MITNDRFGLYSPESYMVLLAPLGTIDTSSFSIKEYLPGERYRYVPLYWFAVFVSIKPAQR